MAAGSQAIGDAVHCASDHDLQLEAHSQVGEHRFVPRQGDSEVSTRRF
jgi:hypothetical protein